jgi:hypothetical protein
MSKLELDPQQIQQMIAMLQQMLPTNNIEDEQPKTKKSKKTNPIKTKKTNIAKEDHENKFMEMSEMTMHKNDSLIDKKLSKFPPTPRNRTFEPVSVSCRVCGKKEKVHPTLILDSVDRYKCNNCSTSQG